MACWLALLLHNKKVLGRGLLVWSLLPWVFSRYSSFLPQSKDMLVRLVGGSKFPEEVIESVFVWQVSGGRQQYKLSYPIWCKVNV